MDEDNLIVITDETKEDLFLQMREIAFAQLNANYELGLDASQDAKDEYVKNFQLYEEDVPDFDEITSAKVFQQYFDMFKEKQLVDGFPAITEAGMFQAVNKLIYYGLMKTYSRLCDEGVVQMYALPNGDFCFVPKGQKPNMDRYHPALEKKVKKIKNTKNKKKIIKKLPQSKKKTKRKKKKE